MSRWRLLTGTSTGSHTVPPEWCRCGDMYVELHEVLEVGERRVAPAGVEVVHERRAVVRCEHGGVAADLTSWAGLRACWMYVAGAVACTSLAAQCRAGSGRASPSTSAPASAKRSIALGVVAHLDADLFEDRVGVVLDDQFEPFVAHDLERLQWRAGQERRRPRGRRGRRCGGAGRRTRARPPVARRARRRSGLALMATPTGRSVTASRRRRPVARLRCAPAGRPARRGAAWARWRGEAPSPRRTAPGSAARSRSRS